MKASETTDLDSIASNQRLIHGTKNLFYGIFDVGMRKMRETLEYRLDDLGSGSHAEILAERTAKSERQAPLVGGVAKRVKWG